ncbi:MAG: hypothetical protein M1419_10355, partial [Bacteroidetes bacterium]|nr:hypothetical protein [Bacteroidota bacterium]
PHSLILGIKYLEIPNKRNIEIFATIDEFGSGASDEVIIPEVANEKGVLITNDKRIQRIQQQYELCRSCGIRIFFIKLEKNSYTYWELVKFLIKHWENITDKILNTKKTLAFEITPRAIKELPN